MWIAVTAVAAGTVVTDIDGYLKASTARLERA
jgi:hypothetical protein